MSVTVQLPEDLAATIDSVSKDRSTFVAEAVRLALRERSAKHLAEDGSLTLSRRSWIGKHPRFSNTRSSGVRTAV